MHAIRRTYFLSVILHPTTSSRVILLQIIVIHKIKSSQSVLVQSIIQIALRVVVFLCSFRCAWEFVSATSSETRAYIPRSSGRGFAKRESFWLVRNVPQWSCARSTIGYEGNSWFHPTWADSRNLSPNIEYNKHLVAFNLFVLIPMEFPYGNDGVSQLLSMCMLQLNLKHLHHVQKWM